MTSWQPLAPSDYVAHVETVSGRFADVVAGAPLDTDVPSCPGWTLRDLAHHLGNVQRWAAAVLRAGTPVDETQGGPGEPAELAAWMRAGSADLLAALRAADPDADCWNFGPPPRRAGFWFRRQAQEATVHLWDAESAAGLPAQVAPRIAADGVDEVVRMFFPRQVRLARCEPLPVVLGLVADEAGAGGEAADLRWTLGRDGSEPDGDVGLADAVVRGPSQALALLLWKRISADDPRLRVEGDRAALRTVLAAPIVP